MPFWAVKLRAIDYFYKRLPNFFQNVNHKKLLKKIDFKSYETLIDNIEKRESPESFSKFQKDTYLKNYEKDVDKIKLSAKRVLNGKINLLGSGEIDISSIDWHKDYKSGYKWPYIRFSKIDTQMLHSSADVKFPWELSRMQWLMPICQSWVLFEEEKYPEHIKKVLTSWIKNNKYGTGVNWSCTMEPSIRVITLIYFYYSCNQAKSWRYGKFNNVILGSIISHLDFISKHIEISDINGNHLISNATALVLGGVFLGNKKISKEWHNLGWKILNNELDKQIYSDGVNFEGSISYHRLVTEFIYLANESNELNSNKANTKFRSKLIKMAEYIHAYTRPDGSCPLVGDFDDGRAINFGGPINNHSYIADVINLKFGTESYKKIKCNEIDEYPWWITDKRTKQHEDEINKKNDVTKSFIHGGSYIVKNESSHLFIDCGPVGLKNRGGHGHNDCLSFTLMLHNIDLVTDPGSYVYTSDVKLRQELRSTKFHNTPSIGSYEINSFLSPDHIWHLRGEADASCTKWDENKKFAFFEGTHSGYLKINPSIRPIRRFVFDKVNNSLAIRDNFKPSNFSFNVDIPIHLSHDVEVEEDNKENIIKLSKNNNDFFVYWENNDWFIKKENSFVSLSYGVKYSSQKLVWTSKNSKKTPLIIYMVPSSNFNDENINSLREVINY